MFIELKVSNFRSIKDPQTLTMVANPATELSQNTCPADFDPELSLVRSAVIYGPNAGGKSNLIKALQFMRYLVVFSAKESQPGEKIPVEPFLFNQESRNQPSEFEITFSKDNIRYQYGFVANENHILEEWLFAYPSGRAQQWFARSFNKKTNKYLWEFSRFFKGSKQSLTTHARNNALFLSTAVQLNNEQLLPPFTWFQQDLLVVTATKNLSLDKTINQIKTDTGKKKILQYMSVADPSIADITLDIQKFSEENLPKNIPQELKDYIKKDMLGTDFTKLNFIHANNISLTIEVESDGTRRYLAFAGRWIDALENGKTIVVDELDNSLHPLAVQFLIGLINNPEINKKKAQLLFSTHDTSLLDNEIFRRDQIWFVEKDKQNATQLYPLLDFSPRKHEALGKGYLQGRYGALPYIGEWRF